MIIYLGLPYSLVGKQWLSKQLEEQNMQGTDLKKSKCVKKFCFGQGEKYRARVKYTNLGTNYM